MNKNFFYPARYPVFYKGTDIGIILYTTLHCILHQEATWGTMQHTISFLIAYIKKLGGSRDRLVSGYVILWRVPFSVWSQIRTPVDPIRAESGSLSTSELDSDG